METQVCQVCLCSVGSSGDYVCKDCDQLSEISRQIVRSLNQTYNHIWRAKLASVVLADRDRFIAALLRGGI